ncbi:MAG: molybdopterin molybdotransferase MoeA [Bacteroidetes bacterium]|nr:molybdopterin molybdotransferase MoeA [Bacteroidota bacterium]
MITFNQALEIIHNHKNNLKIETINLMEAFGRILKEDIYADIDIPSFNKSAMDGYAVRSKDISPNCTLKVIETVRAGDVTQKEVGKNECIKIMTGAIVPSSVDMVIMVEDTEELNNNQVKINKIGKNKNICLQGENMKSGALVIKKNTLIDAASIATLASLGKVKIRVNKLLKITVIITGNEIVEPKELLAEGQLRNSNGPMTISLLKNIGAKVEYLGIAKDINSSLDSLIKKGLKSDILILSGGVSVGEYDLVPDILKNNNVETLFHHVYIKPGKPLFFGKTNETFVFGMPGNPVATLTAIHLFIKPFIKEVSADLIKATLTKKIIKKSNKVEIMPAVAKIIDGKYFVHPLKTNSSANISGCMGYNCFIIVPSDINEKNSGDFIDIVLGE